MKKGVTLEALLRELNESPFCGYCTISASTGVSTLVLDRGRCVLAECRHLKGDDALRMILDQGGSDVDAELRHLSSTQLQLAFEFNRSALVERATSLLDLLGSEAGAKNEREGVVAREAVSRSSPTGKSDTGAAPPAIDRPRTAPSPRVQDSEALSSINRDLEALDSMDLESLADKIRQSCKRTVRRLHLEHLIEEE